MKCLIYTDPHFCERYSIVNSYGDNFTTRLENQIKSLNWAENLAKERGCQYVICAGDFFDKPQLTDQELTALREIEWAPFCVHYFLVGNHESEESDLHFSSAKALEGKNRFVISEPRLFKEPGFELAFLPYIVESERKTAEDYFEALSDTPRLLVSHNDLFGIQMGPVESKVGFKPTDLEKICTLCVNGHLHNGVKVTEKVINLGNLTGKDFGEDAFKYKHNVMIIDTDTFKYELVENPYAFNFYKLEISEAKDFEKFGKLKGNAILSIKCIDKLVKQAREELVKIADKVLDSRIITVRQPSDNEEAIDISDLTMDHLTKFYEICHEKIENSKILEEELAEVLK